MSPDGRVLRLSENDAIHSKERTMSFHAIGAAPPSVCRNGRSRQIVAWLTARARRSVLQYLTRRALGALPDDVLNDIGIARCEIDAVAKGRC
jgi:uncharacterized protein YjiS (DUF1127 family)